MHSGARQPLDGPQYLRIFLTVDINEFANRLVKGNEGERAFEL